MTTNLNMNSGPASGFKDYYGLFAEQRNTLLQKITQIFRNYGYERLETPVIERLETLRGKGGSETEKLIYEVLDTNKESKLGLRFDLTVPLARYISQNKGAIKLPFKRFSYGDVFRGETPQMQKGRLRGFMQCDADCVGIKSDLIDSEIILLMLNIFKTLDLNITIKINNRGLLDALIDLTKISDPHIAKRLIGLIDEVEKIGLENTMSTAKDFLDPFQVNMLEKYLYINGTNNQEILSKLKDLLSSSEKFHTAYENLVNVCDSLSSYEEIIIDPKIARGLDYYTGIIYETFIIDVPEVGSICSGGRYDKLIESLGGPNLPAVGTSVGLDRLLVALEKLGKFSLYTSNKKVFVTIFDSTLQKNSLEASEYFRNRGIETLLWVNPETKLSKQLSECSKLNIPFAIIIGPDEAKNGNIIVKDMNSQTQKEMKIEDFFENLIK